MKNATVAFVVGFFFSVGLALSGMTQPQKVIGFLDLFGEWDPSLMFVMVGALLVHSIAYKLIRKRCSPILSGQWHLPTKEKITPALLVGSFLFGIGWALGGFCPGPALTSLASFDQTPALFVGGMLLGMLVFRKLDQKLQIQK